MQKHEILSSQVVYSSKVGTLVNMEVKHPLKDKIKTYSITKHPDWVNVVAETKDHNIVVISQWRAGSNEISIEVPGGKVDEGEDPQVAGIRELEEETGFCLTPKSKVVSLGWVWGNPAIQDNKMHYYFVNNVEKTKETSFDEMEYVQTQVLSKNKISEMLSDNKITHSYSVLALYKTFKG